MKKTELDLVDALFSARHLGTGYASCLEWAAERIAEGDSSPALRALAGREPGDATVIRKDCELILGMDAIADQDMVLEWAGRYLAKAGRLFAEGSLGLERIQGPIAKITELLGKPDWLVILARNCEYASGLPAYRAAFEAELKYLSRLWSHAQGIADFLRAYDQRVSSKHNPV